MADRVGFVGLGVMGLPMLENLATTGDMEIYAYDSSSTPFEALSQHPSWQKSLFRVIELADLSPCDTVITMLPNSPITNSVILGRDGAPGLVHVLGRGARIIDMGSSDPIETMRLVPILGERGIALVDAPVSGAVVKARSGELAIMVGAEEADFEVLSPLLGRMGAALIRTGAPGSAHAMKALNNYVYAAGLRAAAEAVAMAEALGLDTQRFADVLNASSGRNVATETKLHQFILRGCYDAGFLLALQAKDLATADRLRETTGIAAGQLAQCATFWAEAREALPAQADNTEIHRYIKMLSGSET